MEQVLLTQYAHGAGCGCKIAPAILDTILANNRSTTTDKRLLVGNNSNDDASVYDLENGQALIVTTDFFTPIVNDAYTFGRIAAANAISDIYAMGGKPITAISILGWPVDKISADVAAKVIEGARETCGEAGIIISGGHSIDTPEPFFGLAVNGLISVAYLKKNNTAQPGDVLFLTKPIGLGMLATAHKRGLSTPNDDAVLIDLLTSLNSIGEQLGKLTYITAMTDVTGFGLLGHLIEMCNDGKLSARLAYHQIPLIKESKKFAQSFVLPDATYRNWNGYSNKVFISPTIDAGESFSFLPDPQTNGGLLIAVDPAHKDSFLEIMSENKTVIYEIGKFETNNGNPIVVVE
jgi:selenide,water dikinase